MPGATIRHERVLRVTPGSEQATHCEFFLVDDGQRESNLNPAVKNQVFTLSTQPVRFTLAAPKARPPHAIAVPAQICAPR